MEGFHRYEDDEQADSQACYDQRYPCSHRGRGSLSPER